MTAPRGAASAQDPQGSPLVTSTVLNPSVPLDAVLTTAELARRPARSPNYEAENRAFVSFDAGAGRARRKHSAKTSRNRYGPVPGSFGGHQHSGRGKRTPDFPLASNPLIGTWRLLSYEQRDSSGDISRPFGENPAGYLFYGADGYMSVSIMPMGRPNFLSTKIGAGTTEEKIAAFDTYTSYCGTYEIKGDTVTHHIELSLYPNWSGLDQQRRFELSGDQLTLSARLKMAEGEAFAQATWQRIAR